MHTEPSDYMALSTTITFTAGVTSQTVEVPITDDSAAESSEEFTVSLSNPSPSSELMLGSSNEATVQIEADATIQFDQTSYTVSEGNNVTLTVEVTGDTPAGDTTVMVMTMNGAALGMQYAR